MNMKIEVVTHPTPKSLTVSWKNLKRMLERDGAKLPSRWTAVIPRLRIYKSLSDAEPSLVIEWEE